MDVSSQQLYKNIFHNQLQNNIDDTINVQCVITYATTSTVPGRRLK